MFKTLLVVCSMLINVSVFAKNGNAYIERFLDNTITIDDSDTSKEQINILIERWNNKFPEISEAYQSLSEEERLRFVEVYRGIDVDTDKLNLDQRNRDYGFGDYVYTSRDISVSVAYAMPTKYGNDLSCSAFFLRMLIPKAFFKEDGKIQSLLSTKSEFADLRAFVTEVGFRSKELFEKLSNSEKHSRKMRATTIRWYNYEKIQTDKSFNIPDEKCH